MLTRHSTASLTLTIALASASHATPEITWSSIDSGAVTMSGAGYTLTGTTGQHDAGPVPGPAIGGSASLRGGFWQSPILGGDAGCNPADLAPPFGTLDLADISAFVTGFSAMDPVADLDENGLFDLNDIGLFVGAFTAGCP